MNLRSKITGKFREGEVKDFTVAVKIFGELGFSRCQQGMENRRLTRMFLLRRKRKQDTGQYPAIS